MGETYTVTAGTQSQTVTLDSLIYGSSNGFGGMGGMAVPAARAALAAAPWNGFPGGQNSGGSSAGPGGDGSTPPHAPSAVKNVPSCTKAGGDRFMPRSAFKIFGIFRAYFLQQTGFQGIGRCMGWYTRASQ